MKPYPLQYVAESVLATGARVVVRPIRPDDEAMMVHFHEGLSDRSVYQRYFHMMTLARRTAHERLTRVWFRRLRPRVRPGGRRAGRRKRRAGHPGSGAPAARRRRGGSGVRPGGRRPLPGDRRRRGADAAVDRHRTAGGRLAPARRHPVRQRPMRRLCARAGIPVRPTTTRSLSKPISSCDQLSRSTARERPPRSYTGAIAPAFTVSPPPFVSSTTPTPGPAGPPAA